MRKDNGTLKKIISKLPLICAAVFVILLGVNFFSAGFALVPGEAARYTMSNCELEYPARAGAGFAPALSPSDLSASDAPQVETKLKELKKDGLGQRLSDLALILEFALSGNEASGFVCVEAGQPIGEGLFISRANGVSVLTDLSLIPSNDIGYYLIEQQLGGDVVECILVVYDSVAPIISVDCPALWVGDELDASEFAGSEEDATALVYSFKKAPNCRREGECEIIIEATDRGGNSALQQISAYVFKDTEPPVITGAQDRTVYIGDTVMYKDGVTVTDNRDGEDIDLQVDVRSVNPQEEGRYPVTFTATDSSGLSTTVTVMFTFEISSETLLLQQLDELLQPVLAKIIKEDMTDRQKARAIYDWVHDSINYSGTSNKNSWYECAIEGLTTRNGDCYTYFALSKALLTAVGIENVDVIRRDSSWHPRARHWWNMVYIDGNWWHFDATPRADKTEFFLVTTKQLLAYSNTNLYSHDFDPEEYPKTP